VTILNNSFGAPQRFVLWKGGIKARLSEHRFHIQRLEFPPVTTTKIRSRNYIDTGRRRTLWNEQRNGGEKSQGTDADCSAKIGGKFLSDAKCT